MDKIVQLKAIFYGKVQGVNFRTHVAVLSRELNLVGYVRNLPNGTVELLVEGEKSKIEQLVEKISKNSGRALVEKVVLSYGFAENLYPSFRVERTTIEPEIQE